MDGSRLGLTSIHVRRAVGGDSESLGWLVQHLDPLLRAQVRMRLGSRSRNQADVDDVVAEVWAVVLRKLNDIEPRGDRWAPTFVSFLGATANRLCNASLRRAIRAGGGRAPQRSESGSSAFGVEHLAADTRGVATRAGERDVYEALERALERMSDERREVLVLRLLEQCSNTEIARSQGVAPNTIAVRYRRALVELRERLPSGVYCGLRDLTFGAPRKGSER